MKTSIQNKEGLKACLNNWHIEKSDPIKSFQGLKPEKTLEALTQIERKWEDITPKEPKQFELEETLDIIRSAWKKEGRIDNIGLRHLRRIPWVLFYGPKPWLGEDSAFTQVFLAWLWDKKNSPCIVSFLREFLYVYPQELPTFDLFRNALIKLLNDTTAIRLSRWRDRCEQYCFLFGKDEASPAFAQVWLKNDLGDFEMLGENHASLSGKLAQSNFLLRVHNQLFSKARTLLSKRTLKANELKRILRLSEKEDNKLRFPEQSKYIVESLLLPFVNETNPDQEHQKLIENFILDHFGDPRYGYKTSSKWYGIDEQAREIMTRWRVKVTLDDFFLLLDATSLDRHWKYRHRFWKAYLEKGYITGAWVILGREAIVKAQGIFEHKDYAKGKGMQRDQAVLLLEVGRITVAEWSHNGACRIWLQNNNNSPGLYRLNYDAAYLRNSPNEAIHHNGSKSGRWQRELSEKIGELTGIHIPYRDYMVSEISDNYSRWRM